jgi:hypothetical protein
MRYNIIKYSFSQSVSDHIRPAGFPALLKLSLEKQKRTGGESKKEREKEINKTKLTTCSQKPANCRMGDEAHNLGPRVR